MSSSDRDYHENAWGEAEVFIDNFLFALYVLEVLTYKEYDKAWDR